LYYDHPYLRRFEASVIESTSWQDRPAVVLSQSAFYPTGGGQPHDTGHLGGVPVIEVAEREADKAVLHVLERPLPPEATSGSREVAGEIDWSRRFDHMQQHTGQHILSQAAERLLDAATVGFHLTESSCSVDLNRAPLDAAQIESLEAEANGIVFENRPVMARFVPREELARLPLRKLPEVDGPIRIVQVQDYDWSPCGGTHVRAAGEVGLIKIVRTERRGSETRVEFVCGGRALADYGVKNDLLLSLAARLSVGYWQLDETIARLEEEARSQRKAAGEAREQLLELRAASLAREASALDAFSLVSLALEGESLEEVKHLALKLAKEHRCVALLGLVGEKGHLLFAAPPESPYDLRPILRRACEVIEGGGGGHPHMAQGGGRTGERPRVEQALALAEQMIRNEETTR
jgi:alanyl-tRNA synthetase